MKRIKVGRHLVIDPRVCHGKMTFDGTRVPVQTVLVFMTTEGRTIEQILETWPQVSREAIEEAIKLAAAGWPELLRPPVEKAIRRLRASLEESAAKASHEPVRSGRSA